MSIDEKPSPELEQIVLGMRALRQAAAAMPSAAAALAGARERTGNARFPLSHGIAATPVRAEGVSCEWVLAPQSDPTRRLVYFHGGGYIAGSLEYSRDLAGRIARAANCAVLTVDYRLAPEHPFPAALEDAQAVLGWARRHGPPDAAATTREIAGATAKLFVGGDSAGGGLALAAMLALRDKGEALPDAAALLSPWTDLALTGDSMLSNRDADPLVYREPMVNLVQMYAGDADPLHPLISPLYADLRGLPPMLIQVGGGEVLRDDSTRVAERAKAAGVDVAIEVWPHVFHVWQVYAPVLPEAQRAIEAIGAYLRGH